MAATAQINANIKPSIKNLSFLIENE